MCGACYADVVAGAGTDELCIANNGVKVANKLSPQSIISCSGLGGCAGGSPYLAAEWTQDYGLRESSEFPFMSGQCSPHEDIDKDGCVRCDSNWLSLNSAYRFRPVVLFGGSEFAIRRHIETKGSVMVILVAHTNFQEYFFAHPFGIYDSTAGSPALGNHAVRLIGFGVDRDTKYWIGINSWGNAWGNRGSFKILRGANLCLIEQYPVGLAHMDYVTAGLTNEREVFPSVGEWTLQDPTNPYWTQFLSNNRQLLTEALRDAEFHVQSIETKMTHGYHVRIITDAGNVNIHVSPNGEAKVIAKPNSVSLPEKSVLVH
jgi:hypothetical protein